MKTIKPAELERQRPGAVLVDVREPGEYDGERLQGSVNVPLSSLDAGAARLSKDKPLIVLCRSGQRARLAAERLAKLGFSDVTIVEGRLKDCGELERGPSRVWALDRQMRMVAGALVVAGALLGWVVHPGFYALSAGVGAGLMFSAAADICPMVMVLAKMPWNRGQSAVCR